MRKILWLGMVSLAASSCAGAGERASGTDDALSESDGDIGVPATGVGMNPGSSVDVDLSGQQSTAGTELPDGSNADGSGAAEDTPPATSGSDDPALTSANSVSSEPVIAPADVETTPPASVGAPPSSPDQPMDPMVAEIASGGPQAPGGTGAEDDVTPVSVGQQPETSPEVAEAAAGDEGSPMSSANPGMEDPEDPEGVVVVPPDGACVSPAELVGWATENGGVTGGCGGPEVLVTSKDELEAAAAGSDARIIRVSGTLSGSGMMDIGSNKTIIGESGALITGFGINVDTQTNIIIQNISFTNADDDSINVQNESTNIWIDHCSFSSGADGLLDIKRGSDFITVSYNRFWDHHKTCLLGHNDNNGAQDIGHLRVSYHHNFFDGSNTRNPRVRFGHVHVFNNYYKSVGGYGVAGVKDSHVLVEGNYFENTGSPTLTEYGNSTSGNVNERLNVYDGSGTPHTRGTVEEFPYDYTLDLAEDIPALVSASAGADAM